ncbi:MAG: DUF1778 domain-containing protein [Solirubrobacteraceae bacterium MAG38_C4-C5]|nr:DUF1778 domain-containing protein [Candidatus Siliceabacter maunaloa]
MASVKDGRLQIRVDPDQKRLLERAAAASHQSLSAFVVHAAAMYAEDALAQRSVIRLSRDAAGAFSEALERPGEVNERLARALARNPGFRWVD